MISLDTCREILGPEASTEISDEELREIRAQLYGLAEIALDLAEDNGRVAHAVGEDMGEVSEGSNDDERGHLHPRLEHGSG